MGETELKSLLYECVVELSYVQSAEHISQCASAQGADLVERGMKLLGVKDLSEETYEKAPRIDGKGEQ